ncbi:hypothetical protein BD779DRAFT_1550548 [Infundibulicybe gibba]|nr:hypothetical protein BD779DRAFT_1550548 [Infundibulicybe gibba]
MVDKDMSQEDIQRELEALTAITEKLQIEDTSFLSISAALNQISDELLSLKVSLNRLQFAAHDIEFHLTQVEHERRLISKWTEALDADVRDKESITLMERRREATVRKAKEYHHELEMLLAGMKGPPSITVSDVQKKQAANRIREQELKIKRQKIRAYGGLHRFGALNLQLAKQELQSAILEQTKLIQLRERLLGSMADSVT